MSYFHENREKMLKWGYFLEHFFWIHDFRSKITGPTRSNDLVSNWDQQTAQSDLVYHFHIWVVRDGRSVTGSGRVRISVRIFW